MWCKGGQGGFSSEIFFKDNECWIKNKKEEKETLESSGNLNETIEKLRKAQKIAGQKGTDGPNANTEGVSGGKSGEPGSYGLDQVIYVDTFFGRKRFKGDYSNYLLEEPYDKHNNLIMEYDKTKYKEKSIVADPDLYAKRSKRHTAFTTVVAIGFVVAACVVAAPFVAASSAVSFC